MPFIAISATDTGEIGSRALGAELERMVVDRLTGQGVVAEALSLGAQWPHHLRMAVVAALAYVDVPTLELQSRIGFDTGGRCCYLTREIQGNDLRQTAYADDQRDQYAHQASA